MRQVLFIATATILGLIAAGCDSLPFGNDTSTTEASPVEQSPVASSPAPASPTFSQPTVEAKNTPKGILPPDLISSTDPNQRVQQIKGDRSDPFSLLPTTPTVQLPPSPPPTANFPSGSTPQTRGGQSAQPRAASPSRAPNRSSSTASGRAPAKPAPRSPIAAAPPRPQPVLAKAVQVTGVVQVGDKVYAIVNAPNEPTGRYVEEGQRLAGGQVLVRRIEMNRAEPVVILEQYGVEVVRAVGEGVPAPASGTPAAVAPNPNPAT